MVGFKKVNTLLKMGASRCLFLKKAKKTTKAGETSSWVMFCFEKEKRFHSAVSTRYSMLKCRTGSRREKQEELEQDRFQNSRSQQSSGCYIVLSREVQELSGVHRCSCSLVGIQGQGIIWFYSGGVWIHLSIARNLVTMEGTQDHLEGPIPLRTQMLCGSIFLGFKEEPSLQGSQSFRFHPLVWV